MMWQFTIYIYIYLFILARVHKYLENPLTFFFAGILFLPEKREIFRVLSNFGPGPLGP